MPNIISAFRAEITRLARREVRRETALLKKATAQFRKDRAGLRRRVKGLEGLVARLQRVLPAPGVPVANDAALEGVRYSQRGVKANRKRLGLSASAFAKLCGVSEQTIYNWERGNSRPRAAQLGALLALRGIGKREAAARLETAPKRRSAQR